MHKHGHFCFWGLVDVKTEDSTEGKRFSTVSVISVFYNTFIEMFESKFLNATVSSTHNQNLFLHPLGTQNNTFFKNKSKITFNEPHQWLLVKGHICYYAVRSCFSCTFEIETLSLKQEPIV